MKMLEIDVCTSKGTEPRRLKIAEDSTIEQLLNQMRVAGATIGESGEDILLWVEDEEITCRKHKKIHECGIGHGHRVHCHDGVVFLIVNTREKEWHKKEISYKEVVTLAFGSYSDDPNIVYTVSFSKGTKHKREGTLVKGQ